MWVSFKRGLKTRIVLIRNQTIETMIIKRWQVAHIIKLVCYTAVECDIWQKT